MDLPRLIIRYHNERMLMTLDLTTLVGILMNVYGAPLDLRFEPMSIEDIDATSEIKDYGIRVVRERFWILEATTGGFTRREDLERQAEHDGQK